MDSWTLLAYQPLAQVQRTIERYGWRTRTEDSIRDFGRLFRELDDIHTQGYAVDRGDESTANGCVAAPVYQRNERVAAAISVSGPMTSFQGDALERIIHEVCHRAESLPLRLGYSHRMGAARHKAD